MIRVSQPPQLNDSHRDIINKIVNGGRLVDGEYTTKFEDAFSAFCHCEHGVATSNGTIALYSALKACNIGKGDNVIVPPLTFFATIEAVLWTGANPVFSDIDENTWNMSVSSVKELLEEHKIKCILPVHVFGNPCDMTGIYDTILEKGDGSEYLIEDCAQAHGAFYNNKSVGSLSDIGCYSFMATKNMTNFGEGGICVTHNSFFADKIRKFTHHGMIDRHTHETFGINGKMSEIEAGLGLVELGKLPDYVLHRFNQYEKYKKIFKRIRWLKPQLSHKNALSSRFWAGFYIDENKLGYSTEKLHHKLRDLGVETRYRYKEPLWHQKALGLSYPKAYDEVYKNASKIIGHILGFPIGEHVTDNDIEFIGDIIRGL